MTAAEKREAFIGLMSSGDPEASLIADLITFTDDAPEPAKDWRDKAVELGTGWKKRQLNTTELVKRRHFEVWENGQVWIGTTVIAPHNNDPLSRCRLIDAFLAGLEGKA